MMCRDLKCLLLAAALACGTTSSNAAACRNLPYPKHALRAGEDGISQIGFLVQPDGTAARSAVLNSSGAADLDQATIDGLSTCLFKPVIQDGKPVEAWQEIRYVWILDDDPDQIRAKRAAAQAAGKGDLAARYRLGILLRSTAKTDADRERATIVLRSAAELGLAHAQFEVGRDHEEGRDGVTKDIEEAMRWYRKAAAQGDVMAIQRVEQGILPDAVPVPAPR